MLAKENKVREDSFYREEEKVDRKKREAKTKVNSKILVVAGIMAGFIMSVSVLYGYANITKMKAEISQLESDRRALEAEKDYMIANLEEIKSTSKIEDKAITKLGMDHPREDQVVYIELEDMAVEEKKESKGVFKTIVNSILSLF